MRSARTGVVVLNHRSTDDTLACLASLEASHDLDLDVVVVDNGPPDEAHRHLREAVGGRAQVVASGDNLGYAAGNNIGMALLRERGCRLLWLLNPDTRVGPRTLRRLRARLDADPDCGVVGPRLVLPGDPPKVAFDGGLVDRSRHGATSHLGAGVPVARAAAPRALDVDFVTGAAMLLRTRVLDDAGPLPEDWFLYFEETAWCLAVRESGWRVMVEQRASMEHLKRSSNLLPQPYYLYYMTRNRMRFAAHLGADPEAALPDLEASLLEPWRTRVARTAPSWLPVMDALVDRAVSDARAGRTGPTDLSDVPAPTAEGRPTTGAPR